MYEEVGRYEDLTATLSHPGLRSPSPEREYPGHPLSRSLQELGVRREEHTTVCHRQTE